MNKKDFTSIEPNIWKHNTEQKYVVDLFLGRDAEGVTTVEDIHYIERGYEDFPQKLRGLGALIEKVDSEKEFRKFQMKIG